MRINQFVAAASGLSRRAADTAISSGRVLVGGQPASLGVTVSEDDEITLDGQVLHLTTTKTYIMLNKPTGYVSSHVQQGSGATLYELLPPEHQQLRLVGRLDRDSSGLILLTDDGDFIQRYAHPSNNKQKRYELTLDKPVSPADIARLEQGVRLDDGPSRLQVLRASGRNITVGLGEGRNRQLRRTFGALGYGVQRLHRTHIGPFSLGDLPSGQWRNLERETSA